MTVFDCFKNKEAVFTQSTEVFAVKPEPISVADIDSNEIGDRKTCKMSARRILWHVGFDVPVFTIAFLLIGLFELGVIPCNKLGFFCNDPGLDYVFNGDTVTTQLLISVLLLVPSIVVLITEYFLYEQPDYILKENFKNKLFRAMKTKCWLIKDYFYGLFVNLAIVEIMKGVTGMPRPTFFDLCRPDTLANCTGGEFVSDFTCTSSYSWWYQLDSYRSFPSGHTSLSIHAGFFTVWYLQRRAFSWSSKPALLVPLVQLTCIAFAAVASLTRITDHRHHWWDVAVGAVIGFSTVWYTCMILCKNFKWLEESYPDTTNNNNNNDRSLRKTPLEDTRLVMTPGTQHLV